MTTSNPNEPDNVPDERTEEEELDSELSHIHGKIAFHEEEIVYAQEEIEKLYDKAAIVCNNLREVRKENANFLKDYAPGAIGSDVEDNLTKENTCN